MDRGVWAGPHGGELQNTGLVGSLKKGPQTWEAKCTGSTGDVLLKPSDDSRAVQTERVRLKKRRQLA